MPLADLKRFGNFEISSNCTWIIFGTCLNICSYCLRSIFTKFFTCPGHVLRYLALVSELFLKIWSVLDMSLTGFRSSRCLTFRLERMTSAMEEEKRRCRDARIGHMSKHAKLMELRSWWSWCCPDYHRNSVVTAACFIFSLKIWRDRQDFCWSIHWAWRRNGRDCHA